jgi:hypothetical protein
MQENEALSMMWTIRRRVRNSLPYIASRRDESSDPDFSSRSSISEWMKWIRCVLELIGIAKFNAMFFSHALTKVI